MLATVPVCLVLAAQLQAQDQDICTGRYGRIAVDSNGILTALMGGGRGLVRGEFGHLRNAGPDATITAFVVTRQGKLFASGEGNLYRLDDDSTWTRFTGSGISLVGADGSGILYGGKSVNSDSLGLYRSTDEGESWELGGVVPEGASYLFLSPNGELWIKLNGSLADYFVSRDGGATWESPGDMPGDNTLRLLHFDAGGTLIASSGYTALFYRDSAGIWHEPPRTIPRLHIWAFTEIPPWAGTDRVGHLYACNGIGDIVRSTDRGATWELLIYGGSYPTGVVNRLAAGKEYLYVATDNGLWRLHHDDLTFEQCGLISGVAEAGPGFEGGSLQLRP